MREYKKYMKYPSSVCTMFQCDVLHRVHGIDENMFLCITCVPVQCVLFRYVCIHRVHKIHRISCVYVSMCSCAMCVFIYSVSLFFCVPRPLGTRYALFEPTKTMCVILCVLCQCVSV